MLHQIAEFTHSEIGDIAIFKDDHSGTGAIAFTSLMHVNTDGAPDSYHPDNIGITHICNGISVGPPLNSQCKWTSRCLKYFEKAKAEGFTGPTKICFFGMVKDANGVPVLQKTGDPKPGYYVSTTALTQPGSDLNTQKAYLDSNKIPFIVIPSGWLLEVVAKPQ